MDCWLIYHCFMFGKSRHIGKWVNNLLHVMVYCLSTTPQPIPRFLANLLSFFSQSETSILTLCSRWQYFWLDNHYMAASTLKHICECFYWRPRGIIKYVVPIHSERCVITSLANWMAGENADICSILYTCQDNSFFPRNLLFERYLHVILLWEKKICFMKNML